MLDRTVVQEFLDCGLKEVKIEISGDIKKEALVEAFRQYVEDDYCEWLKDTSSLSLGTVSLTGTG